MRLYLTIEGHLGNCCQIYTGAEIVIAGFEEGGYRRDFAEHSGYEELGIQNK